MGWYYAVLNQRLGPVSDTEFAALVANGTITPATLVWRQGLAGWLPYAQAIGPGSAEHPDHAVCAVSGRRYPKSQMLQYEGRWVSAEHRDIFFQRLREGMIPAAADAMPGPYGYAGFWLRFVAKFLDGILLAVVNWIVILPLGFAIGLYSGAAARPGNIGLMIGYQVFANAFGLAVGITYDIWMIRKYDATLGKMALGLKILRVDGSKLTTGRIVGRYFSHIISGITLGIGYMMAGWDDEKRALHDRICDTRVVKTRP